MSQKIPFTYNFKTLTAVLFAALLAEHADAESIKPKFEAIADGKDSTGADKFKYKRRSETVEITLPEELDSLAASTTPTHAQLITAAVTRVITDFVKAQYIDVFTTVGPHDLDTIATVQAQSGSRSVAFSFSDETFEKSLNSLRTYLTAAMGNAAVAEAVTAAAKLRFARSGITRSIGKYDEDILTKLQGRVDAWGLWLEENSPEEAEEFAPVHSCWSASISKQLKSDQTVDIASIL